MVNDMYVESRNDDVTDEARSFLDVEEMTEAIWEKFVEVVYLYPEMRMEIVWKFEDVGN
jgi:hypothetical protein